jgi:hypothetical protein
MIPSTPFALMRTFAEFCERSLAFSQLSDVIFGFAGRTFFFVQAAIHTLAPALAPKRCAGAAL